MEAQVIRKYRVRLDLFVEADSPTAASLLAESMTGATAVSVLPLEAVAVTVLSKSEKKIAEFSPEVIKTAATYGITLPAPKKGQPEWRTLVSEEIHEPIYGQIQGIPTLRGKVVLTNGLTAILVREDGKWFEVHYTSFVSDDDSAYGKVYDKAKKEPAPRPSPIKKALELYA